MAIISLPREVWEKELRRASATEGDMRRDPQWNHTGARQDQITIIRLAEQALAHPEAQVEASPATLVTLRGWTYSDEVRRAAQDALDANGTPVVIDGPLRASSLRSALPPY